MSKFRPWAIWRRLQYGVGFTAFWIIVGGAFYYTNTYTPPTCFDNLQNNTEAGVDCDGSCVRICASSVTPPVVEWAESFKIQDGQYNAVAYIQNRNLQAGTPVLKYKFQLLENGSLIAERSGTTVLPPNTIYPIFEGRIITTDGREPTETRFELEPAELWLPANYVRNQFRVIDLNLENTDTTPRLTTKIENTELTDADGIETVATIFDSEGKPQTVSRSFIDKFASRSIREVVFTWPNSIAKTIKSCEVPSDIMVVLDRSGSMSADGGEPPEPLESAKIAAQNFILQAQSSTQIGLVSYAASTTFPIEQVLTSDKETAAKAATAVAMGKDGTQYTNMGDAFATALAELTSERHRDNARKVIVFLTDGDVTMPFNPETNQLDRNYAATYALEKANAAKDASVTIYTIGFGQALQKEDGSMTRDIELIRSLASEPGLYYEAPTIADLENVYKQIATGLCEAGPTKIEVIPKNKTTFTPLQ
jgi:Mg-chelatase subunit ChlD